MTLLLIGFMFGALFGIALAVVLVRHEARTDRRPGYVNDRRSK